MVQYGAEFGKDPIKGGKMKKNTFFKMFGTMALAATLLVGSAMPLMAEEAEEAMCITKAA